MAAAHAAARQRLAEFLQLGGREHPQLRSLDAATAPAVRSLPGPSAMGSARFYSSSQYFNALLTVSSAMIQSAAIGSESDRSPYEALQGAVGAFRATCRLFRQYVSAPAKYVARIAQAFDR